MNTAENLFDGTHGTLIDALQTAKRQHFMRMAGPDGNPAIAAKCSAVRLPVIHTPRVSWWQCTRLSRLGFPTVKDMVGEMAAAMRNADETVAQAVEQLVQSSFAPELQNTLEMYFTYEGAPDVYDGKRVSQVYVLFAFVTGTEDTAQAIQQIVPMTEDVKAMRARIAMA